MVRHIGTRHQPIITYCPKYRIEGITLHGTDRGSQKQCKSNTQTVNEPLIELGPQNLLSDALDIVPLHRLSHATTYCSTYNSAFVLEIAIT